VNVPLFAYAAVSGIEIIKALVTSFLNDRIDYWLYDKANYTDMEVLHQAILCYSNNCLPLKLNQ